MILDECGSVDMSKIGHEAIGVLALIVIFTIIPIVGSLISSSLVIPNITETVFVGYKDPINNTTPVYENISKLSPWVDGMPSGINLWEQIGPIFQISAVIVIVGFILKVIYDFKTSNG